MAEIAPAGGRGNLTAEGRKAANEVDSAKAWIVCLTIEHASLTAPLLLCDDADDLVRGDRVFHAVSFTLDLPSEDPDRQAEVSLRIGNFSIPGDPQQRRLGDVLETLPGDPARITIEGVFSHRPEVAEYQPLTGELREIENGDLYVTGTISFDDGMREEPYPGSSFDPAGYPGLHRSA